jgi:hypothetical protein
MGILWGAWQMSAPICSEMPLHTRAQPAVNQGPSVRIRHPTAMQRTLLIPADPAPPLQPSVRISVPAPILQVWHLISWHGAEQRGFSSRCFKSQEGKEGSETGWRQAKAKSVGFRSKTKGSPPAHLSGSARANPICRRASTSQLGWLNATAFRMGISWGAWQAHPFLPRNAVPCQGAGRSSSTNCHGARLALPRRRSNQECISVPAPLLY